MMEVVSETTENWKKEGNADYQCFVLFTQCFQKSLLCVVKKSGLCGKM